MSNPNELKEGYKRTTIALEIDCDCSKLQLLSFKNLFEAVESKMNELDFIDSSYMFLADSTNQVEVSFEKEENPCDCGDQDLHILAECGSVIELCNSCKDIMCVHSREYKLCNDEKQSKLEV